MRSLESLPGRSLVRSLDLKKPVFFYQTFIIYSEPAPAANSESILVLIGAEEVQLWRELKRHIFIVCISWPRR